METPVPKGAKPAQAVMVWGSCASLCPRNLLFPSTDEIKNRIIKHGPADILKTMDLITELESRDEHLGFEQQRLALMSKLVDADRKYLELFDELAGKLEGRYPEDVLAYQFKNSYNSEDWNAADSVVKNHLQNHPGSAQAHYLLAVVEFKRGHIERAQALANRALEMDPSNMLFQEEVPKLQKDPKNWVGYFMLPSVTYSF
jgi:tetratricopeptide (TPR) repeat protein